jgi:hypothetical protein
MRNIISGVIFTLSLGMMASMADISEPFGKSAIVVLGLSVVGIAGIFLSVKLAMQRGGNYGYRPLS